MRKPTQNRVAALLLWSLASTFMAEPAAFASDRLLHASDLVYLGAFRVPGGTSGCADPNRCSFHYGGTALAYDPLRNALFMVGHDWNQWVAEVSIPELVNSKKQADLKTATFVQPFVDITDGHIKDIKEGSARYSGSVKIGGLMVYGDRVIGTVYGYYDAASQQKLSHFTSSLELSATGDFLGMFQVGAAPKTPQAGFVSGYLAQIPKEWQSRFGAPVLTGNAALGIIGRSSLGPAAFVFDPKKLGDVTPVPATAVVFYPLSHPTLGTWGTTNPYFNGATEIKGAVFPNESSSVLFFGRHGTGPFCYGPGTADPKVAGLPAASNGVGHYCYDPVGSAKGTHAYPYRYQVWAYNAADLVKVKNGEKLPWQVKPYEVWNFDLPFQQVSNPGIQGVAYDPARQLIYLSQRSGDGNLPVIHVFSISPAVAADMRRESPPAASASMTKVERTPGR